MTDPTKLSEEMKARLYAHEHGLFQDDLGRAIETTLAHGIADDFSRKELISRVAKHHVKKAFSGPFDVPKTSGDFVQGFDWKDSHGDAPIAFPLAKRLQHGLTIATSGAGKSNLSKIEILNLLPHVPSIVAVDIRKNEYACLAPLARQLGYTINVVSGRAMKWNPLEIPNGVETHVFAANLVDVLIGSLGIPPVARRLLYQCLLDVYQKHTDAVHSQNPKTFPTLLDLRKAVQQAPHAHAQSREAILNRIDPILQSLRGTFGYKKGWSVDELFSHHIVFSLYDLTADEQNLLINSLLLSLFISAVSKHETNCPTRVLFVFDEAARILKGSDNALAQWFPLVRGSGICLDLSSQYMAHGAIAHEIVANCRNLRIGVITHPADFDAMANAMSLDSSQRKWLKTNLKQPGQFAMRVSGLCSPFLFKVPLLKVPQNIPDHDCPKLDSLDVIPDNEMLNWQPGRERVKAAKTIEPAHRGIVARSSKLALPSDELRLLRAIATEPCQAASYFPAIVHFSKEKTRRLRKLLVGKKMIVEKSVQKSGRGRPAILLAPSPDAFELLEKLDSREGQ